MENLTHSLVGAALAEAALPARATRAQRTLFFTASVLAANLPDGDLLYSGITLPPPLGYLLHHRGYTHTVVGCLALACLVGAFGFIPAVRERLGADRRRWWILIVVALLSHITLDWWNSYGVHPFWPFDDRWYYGDAINIFEPLLWVMLGVVGAMNAVHFVSRALVFLLVVGGVAGVTALGLIRTDSAIAAGILVVVLLLTLWRVPRRARAAVSLALSAVFVIASFAMSHVARTTLIQLRQRAPIGDIIDVVLTPAAANPFSWSAVTIEHDVKTDSYTLGRGHVELCLNALARWHCSVDWKRAETQPLASLRQLRRDNCRVAAWLQFGRAPMIEGIHIFDYRFGGSNFTDMPFAEGVVPCPRHLTPWRPPRADIL